MQDFYPLKCCGVMELDGLHFFPDPKKALLDMHANLWAGNKYKRRVPFILFTGDVNRYYGQALAAFLVENRLGTVLASEERKNWTENTIRVWIWSPDYEKLEAWYKEHEPPAPPVLPVLPVVKETL